MFLSARRVCDVRPPGFRRCSFRQMCVDGRWSPPQDAWLQIDRRRPRPPVGRDRPRI